MNGHRKLFADNVGPLVAARTTITMPKRGGQRGTRPAGDVVTVRCWCERTEVEVALADVRAGVTASCGRPACDEMERSHHVHG